MDLTRYDKLRSAIRRTLSPDEAAAADRALEYAAEHTASQVRHDGSPMLDHAAEVARIGLEEIGLGGDSVVAAILHDVVRTASRQDEETFLRLTDEIRDRFGKEVLGMTVSLSHISDIRLKASREQAENFRELIVSYSEDPRVILIKLADRLEVMRRLEIFPREKWRKKSWESLNLYAQIAHKLGLYNIKSELEDIALRYLIWYGAGRFWIEGLRTDSLLLVPSLGLRASQLVAAAAVVGGVALEIFLTRKYKGKPLMVTLALTAENRTLLAKAHKAQPELVLEQEQLVASSPRKLFIERTNAYNEQVKQMLKGKLAEKN